jgi:hypothetical protein
MFNIFSKSPRYPTIREALVQAGLTAAVDPAQITVLETRGVYSGRKVNFFRAFEAAHRDVLVVSGHVEHEGAVVVDTWPAAEREIPSRTSADRAGHADDERLVFWNADAARSAEATLSAPAATWKQAQGGTP